MKQKLCLDLNTQFVINQERDFFQQICQEDNALLSNNSKVVDIVNDSKLIFVHPRMYNLAMHDSYGIHSLMIDVKGKGFQAYTFTFGQHKP